MPRISFHKLRKLLLYSLLVVVIFSGGYLAGTYGLKARVDSAKNIKISRIAPPGKESIDFSLFWHVWDTLETSYFDKTKIDRTQMVYGAISGMVAALGDPYTSFLAPSENKVVQEDLSGSFEGIGIQIGFRGSQLAVIAPLPDSPAEASGVMAGDYIIGIKDETKDIDTGTDGMSLPDAVELIRGRAGTTVTLALRREGVESTVIVDIKRAKLDVPSVVLTYTGENSEIAHLRLLKFVGETDGEWGKAVNEIVAKGSTIKGIVLDLRNNPGGYLQGSVDIASEFLKVGSIVTIEEHAGGEQDEFKVGRIGKLLNMPLVVVVNRGSASAAEILSGALMDHSRAKVVGETTFGKGTIQEPQQLKGGSALHITIARWLTPNETWVNEKGITPDVAVDDNPETEADEVLDEAVNLL